MLFITLLKQTKVDAYVITRLLLLCFILVPIQSSSKSLALVKRLQLLLSLSRLLPYRFVNCGINKWWHCICNKIAVLSEPCSSFLSDFAAKRPAGEPCRVRIGSGCPVGMQGPRKVCGMYPSFMLSDVCTRFIGYKLVWCKYGIEMVLARRLLCCLEK